MEATKLSLRQHLRGKKRKGYKRKLLERRTLFTFIPKKEKGPGGAVVKGWQTSRLREKGQWIKETENREKGTFRDGHWGRSILSQKHVGKRKGIFFSRKGGNSEQGGYSHQISTTTTRKERVRGTKGKYGLVGEREGQERSRRFPLAGPGGIKKGAGRVARQVRKWAGKSTGSARPPPLRVL